LAVHDIPLSHTYIIQIKKFIFDRAIE